MKQRFDRLVSGEDRSVRVLVNELRALVVAYVKQETLEPVKGLVHYVLWGLIGSFFLATASVLSILAVIRLLQTETGTALTGDLSWVPYVGGFWFAMAVIGVTLTRIGRSQ